MNPALVLNRRIRIETPNATNAIPYSHTMTRVTFFVPVSDRRDSTRSVPPEIAKAGDPVETLVPAVTHHVLPVTTPMIVIAGPTATDATKYAAVPAASTDPT